MATFRSVPVASNKARELAELYGIRADLDYVQSLCNRLLSETAEFLDSDTITHESVSVHAIIRYARCFTTGVRPTIYPSVVKVFSPEQRKLHKFLIEYRSKFVAHSVNPYEQNEVTVGVPEEPPDGWQPTGLSYFHGRQTFPGPQLIEALRDLAGCVKSHVDGLMSPLESEVLQEISEIPPEELAKRELIELRILRHSDVTRRRR